MSEEQILLVTHLWRAATTITSRLSDFNAAVTILATYGIVPIELP